MTESPEYELARDNLARQIEAVRDYMQRNGLMPERKAIRDPAEPGRRQKEEREDELGAALQQHLRRQEKEIRATGAVPPNPDPRTVADVTNVLAGSVQDGVALFSNLAAFDVEYTLINAAAAAWARTAAFELVRGIDDVSRRALQQAINQFVTTPGYTIGDVIDAIKPVFGQARAANIAVTEITRAYAQGNQLAGETMAKDWPEVRVIKRWHTNNDSIVCPLCAPLNNQVVDIDKPFVHPKTGKEYFNPPIHPNDRCWTTTTTRTRD